MDNNPYGIVEYEDFKQFLQTLAQHSTHHFNSHSHDRYIGSNAQSSSNIVAVNDHSPLPAADDHHHFVSQENYQHASMHNLEELLEDKYSTDFNISINPAAKGSPRRTSSSSTTDSWNVENDPIYDNHLQNWNQITGTAKIRLDKLVTDLGNLIHTCEEEQFSSLVEQILSHKLLFINAVFHKQGSRYIIKLIKKIKKTDYAFTLTQILAPWFYHLTTHHTARFVVESCLNYLGTGPNEVLYEQAINRFQELATNELGCLSLKDCIDTITGEQRTTLLNHVAYFSNCLSRDPYGNYVVQHVLQLKNSEINHRILKCLSGQFVALSQKKGASYVVERCLECCPVAVDAVVQEILTASPSTPYQLARHPTGNYVIQKALNRTKELCLTGLFGDLVKSLEPHKRDLIRYTGGKHVINLIRDGSTPLP